MKLDCFRRKMGHDPGYGVCAKGASFDFRVSVARGFFFFFGLPQPRETEVPKDTEVLEAYPKSLPQGAASAASLLGRMDAK